MNATSRDKSRIPVLLLEGIDKSAEDALRADGYSNISTTPKPIPEDQLIGAISGAYLVGIRSNTYLTKKVLEKAKNLIGIGCFCIGTNQVDLDAARDMGIPVFNAPFSNTRSVAELVIAETILLMRGVPWRNAAAHRGEWVKTAEGSHEVRGKTLGIIGYGHIGTQVGVLAEALGMDVIFHDIENKLTLGNARQTASLGALLAEADAVTLHVPETAETKNMIGAAELAAMKRGSILINAARGTVVDIPALAEALRSGHLRAAAVDVFPKEPKAGEPFESPLREFDNVILTPHIGGSTVEAQRNIGREVALKLIKYSNAGSTLTAVNFPEVSLTETAGRHRVLHIHENKPGMLEKINAAAASFGINITGQYLNTMGNIGYVVMDVQTTNRGRLRDATNVIKQIPGTLKARFLY